MVCSRPSDLVFKCGRGTVTARREKATNGSEDSSLRQEEGAMLPILPQPRVGWRRPASTRASSRPAHTAPAREPHHGTRAQSPPSEIPIRWSETGPEIHIYFKGTSSVRVVNPGIKPIPLPRGGGRCSFPFFPGPGCWGDSAAGGGVRKAVPRTGAL